MSKSIGAAYEYVLSLLKVLCEQYGESKVFTGNYSYQVEAQTMNQTASKIANLHDATTALLGVSDQGGGCPVPGKEQLWPRLANISAGPLGGGLSHLARFTEIAAGRKYRQNDTIQGGPTGDNITTNWGQVYTFQVNPTVNNFPVGSKAYNLSLAFASKYTSLLGQLHSVFNGSPEEYNATVGTMYELAKMATQLMKTPDPTVIQPGHSPTGIGPPWEYVKAT